MNEKIGMYTEDEILEHLTEGEGRCFLGRSMYDAIFDKIHTLKTENEQLQQENKKQKEAIDKSIKLIEDTYYSKNTTDVDSIVLSNNKLLKIREILKEVE